MTNFAARAAGLAAALVALACDAPGTPTPQEDTANATQPAESIPEFFYKGLPWEQVDANGLRFVRALPDPYDPARTHPTLLALAPGPQDDMMIRLADDAYWHLGPQRGWIVVSPEAPGGQLFFEGAETLIPALLDQLLAEHRVEGGRFHLAGVSNGGNSAFRLAGLHPDRFCSLLALPGLPVTDADFERLDRFAGIPVFLFVGFHDTLWSQRMRETYARLDALGHSARIRILPGVGHALGDAIGAEELFDLLDAQRASCGAARPQPASPASPASAASPDGGSAAP